MDDGRILRCKLKLHSEQCQTFAEHVIPGGDFNGVLMNCWKMLTVYSLSEAMHLIEKHARIETAHLQTVATIRYLSL